MVRGTAIGAPGGADGAGGIDLGREPALTVDPVKGAPQRHAVSIRWLTGTILTGLTSTILMGGALMAALDGRHQLAVPPEIGRVAGASAGDSLGTGQKSDRIKPTREPVADRQVIQVSTVSRQGDRDLIKMKPFALISTSLATTITDASAGVPRFDPMKLVNPDANPDAPPPVAGSEKLGVVADEGASGDSEDSVPVSGDAATAAAPDGSGDDVDAAAPDGATADAAPPVAGPEQIYGANVEGEVSVKVTPFPLGEADAKDPATISVADAEAAARALAPAAPQSIAAIPYVDPDRFSFGDANSDPFAALGVKIVPENVSFVAKSAPSHETEERIVSIDKKDTLQAILTGAGLDAKDADAAAKALGSLTDLDNLKAGQKLRVLVGHEGDATRILRVSLYDQGVHQATVARRDDDSFVRADEPESSTDEFETADQPAPADDTPMPTLYDSLYETAREQQIPEALITELLRIISYDVDFQSRIAPGDSLEVFHSLPEPGATDADDEILYCAITIDGVTKRYYRFRSPDDGVVDYFDDEGRSAKKFLMRKPMNVGIVRSPFGYRRHPILGYVRLHPGVDWAAPRGTPVMAAGNGVVEKAGWASGYGNFTLIRHTNGYETAYGHQSSIARGIRPGVKVRQGEIIGYVGSTGLSTGPHLHYEVRINEKPVDPLRVRLPRGRVLQGDMLADFKAEKERIDTLLGTPAAKVANASDSGDAATN